jgi:LysM repeat protein
MFVVYKVKENDTLSQIALNLKSTTAKIQSLNGVERCREGERLLVEVLYGEPYTVKPFDTVEKIALRFGIRADAIREHNGISEVFVGEVIMLP